MRSTDQLVADHAHILEVLGVLERVLGDVERTRAVPVEVLKNIVTFSQSFVDRCHHGKEEGCLFPCLEGRGIPNEGGPIGVMLQEHEMGRALVREIAGRLERYRARQAEVDEVLAPCREYVDLLRQHIRKEEEMLYPMGEAVMETGDDDATVACFEETEAAVGDGMHAALVKLAQELTDAAGDRAAEGRGR